jgi:hypothetical protein
MYGRITGSKLFWVLGSAQNPEFEKVMDEYAVIQAEPHRSLYTVRLMAASASGPLEC